MSIMQFSMTVFGKQKCRKKIDFFLLNFMFFLGMSERKEIHIFMLALTIFFKKGVQVKLISAVP